MGKEVGSPLVSLICNTYNHVDIIRQCLDGFWFYWSAYDFYIGKVSRIGHYAYIGTGALFPQV